MRGVILFFVTAMLSRALFAGPNGAGGAPEAVWVEEGRPLARIVTDDFGDEAPCPADLLNEYIEKASGVRLPVVSNNDDASASQAGDGPVVYIGPKAGLSRADASAVKDLGEEGFAIVSDGKSCAIGGPNRLATLYGVCAFLEQALGVRWLWDDPTGEIVPRARTIRVAPFTRVEKPDFRIRWIGRGDWALRNRMNAALGQTGEFRVIGTAHTFLTLVPPGKYLKDHPEYYAVMGGKRPDASMAKAMKERLWQLCTSNPGVVKAVAATIDDMLQKDPGIRMIAVGPEDT